MKIFPAIDLRDGKVVRLTQGDYSRMKVYGDDPLATAHQFKAAGASYLHVVDLDGAIDGAPRNFDVLQTLARESGLFIQTGGGIRDDDRVQAVLDLGVGRVILGTAALRDPVFLARMVDMHGEKIAVGVDAKDGKVAVGGWLEVSSTDGLEFCASLRDMGVKTVIYTDIERDGQLAGTNLDVYRALASLEGLDIVASGGITDESELQTLRGMGTYGAILGKALYERRIDLARAIAIAEADA